MKKKWVAATIALICNLFITTAVAATAASSLVIPVMDESHVFARFDDALPVVVNYYTAAAEASVVAFYQSHYGEPIRQTRKRGRLSITFSHGNNLLRVVISPQDGKRQVDVMMNKKQPE